MKLHVGEAVIVDVDAAHVDGWRDRALPTSLSAWDAWDTNERRKRGRFAGLKFFSRTNSPNRWLIVSRHWPHRLCWDWLVDVSIYRKDYWGTRGFIFLLSRRYRTLRLRLFVIEFAVYWQDYGYMANSGPSRIEAPKILWAHHLQHAEPAGTA